MIIPLLFTVACIGLLIWAGLVFVNDGKRIDWTYIKLLFKWFK